MANVFINTYTYRTCVQPKHIPLPYSYRSIIREVNVNKRRMTIRARFFFWIWDMRCVDIELFSIGEDILFRGIAL